MDFSISVHQRRHDDYHTDFLCVRQNIYQIMSKAEVNRNSLIHQLEDQQK